MRNKDAKHVKRVQTQYGLTPNQYRRLLEFQQYRCALCGVHEDVLPERLCIDHHHGSGEVRGALCRNCNVSVGSAEKHQTGAFSYYLAHPPLKEMALREEDPDAPRPA